MCIWNHTPQVSYVDLVVHDHEELPLIQDLDTTIQGIPDVVLDECEDHNNIEDPFINMDEVGLGIYMIHEEDAAVPKLQKDDSQHYQ